MCVVLLSLLLCVIAAVVDVVAVFACLFVVSCFITLTGFVHLSAIIFLLFVCTHFYRSVVIPVFMFLICLGVWDVMDYIPLRHFR